MVITANPLTLDTNPLTTGFGLDPDSFVEEVYRNGKQPAYPRETVVLIAQNIARRSREFSDDGRSVGGQVLVETDSLRFTGDVQPGQYNFGGIGATGGGVRGEVYTVLNGDEIDVPASVDAGVLAMFSHRSTYQRGEKQFWGTSIQKYYNASHRYANVVAAGKAGVVKKLGDYGKGNWAVDPLYAPKIVAAGNRLRAEGAVTPNMVRIAIGAGHRNLGGGNPREQQMTAPLTRAYYDECQRWGFDVRSYTPDNGLGFYNGTLSQAVNQVNTWASQGWVADILVENHFQGLQEGSNSGRGAFVIYPDWGNDVDADVTNIFAPLWTPEITARTGLPLYGNGTMSEKRTGVGADGHRLGVFSTTVGLKTTTTRMIIEHGCHTCPADYQLIKQESFYKNCAAAFCAAVGKWYNVSPPSDEYVPGGPGGVDNGYYLVGPFWNVRTTLGDWFHPAYGLVTSGMIIAPVDGVMRYVQFTEKGLLACYPQNLPHGVPEGNPWFVRNVTPTERLEALQYAQSQEPPLVGPGVV